MFKKLVIHLKLWTKLIVVIIIAMCIILGTVNFIYKPTYSVKLNGEFIGYTDDKKNLQDKINSYMKVGDNQNIAFVEIDTLPEYEKVMLKKDIETNTDEIFSKVIASGVKYYKYYAILDGEEEKYYVPTFEEAEKVIEDLKDKDSNNIDEISYSLKYSTENKDYTAVADVVEELYEEKPKVTTSSYSGQFSTWASVDYNYTPIGINLIPPCSGLLTSRFGESSGRRHSVHTGLDIATSSGTPIKACAAGTVVFSSYNGSYGNMIIVDHGGGVQTYYAHIMNGGLLVGVGEKVSQGEVIGKVGSTGNSTGPHCHLEVRINGVAKNPYNYIY